MDPTPRLTRSLAVLVLLPLLAAVPAAGALPQPSATGQPAADSPATVLPSPFAADADIRSVGERISHLPGGVRDKADAILDFIFEETAPAGLEGLAFEYRAWPTRTAAEAFHHRNGNCLSLVNLYLALARSAGLEAFPVEVEDFQSFSRRGGAVVRATHVVGGLWVNGTVLTVDFLPDKPKTYRRMDRISDRRHAALVYNAVATEAMLEGRTERAEVLYREALRLEPENAEAWNNHAVLAKRQGDLATARERLERALAADPHFLPALNNLAALERHEGNSAAAEALEERALAEKNQSPYFLADQALRRVAGGDLDGAEALLVRARHIDREIPEVHLALGRLDLARGHGARAEEHFAEARKRSSSFGDRYQQKLDGKIGKLTLLASHR